MNQLDRVSLLKEKIAQKILVIDGATGTALQEMNLTANDFGGAELEGCNENLILTKPEAIEAVHKSYLEAGADIIETNTFGGTAMVLAEYQLQGKSAEINTRAVEIARKVADAYTTLEKPRFVAGAMGPTTKSLSVTGGITFDEMAKDFAEQAYYLTKAGADYLLFETALDTLNLKAAYSGTLSAFKRLGYKIPIAISGTIETMGSMLAGQGVESLYTSTEHMNPLYIGLNCATGPEFMRDHIRTLSEISRFPVAVVPNAGIPDADGNYPESPDEMAVILNQFIQEGWLNIIGGCCGTTPTHIRALAAIAESSPPRSLVSSRKSRLSGIDALTLEDEGRPYIVGERTNVIGSKKFKRLIANEQYEEAAEIARQQVKAGAHIIDVCLSNPDRDEVKDTIAFYEKMVNLIKVPIMVDSQVPEVVEAAFKLTQGKCILNSINLEDGETAFQELLPLVKQYGASVVVGCIRGEMAVTAADKLDVATESYELLTQKYGIPEEDIMFDPLVFPCGTGDENYFGSGAETIEGVRLIKEKYPRVKTTLGISNVSFGLPPAGREVLNSVFVNHCTKAGLDTAIVNSEKLVRFSQITEEEKKLCDDLLWYRTDNGNDPIANFATFYRDKTVQEKPKVDRSLLSIEEKLEINIVQGTKEYLTENLEEALTQWDPLGVINNPLMSAMGIVGKLFNDNELIVAEVLQSAEVMKTAVSYLEQFMEKNETNVRGSIILATVKGDVHDIGKNLVQIILENNGYKVIDLGIKCPPETLINACKEHQPDMIGLSGLLVKSAQQMVITAKDLKLANINCPILVGGAALTETFTTFKIDPEYDGITVYCKDAMTGLSVANELTNKDTVDAWKEAHQKAQEKYRNGGEEKNQFKSTFKRKVKNRLSLDHAQIQATAPGFNPIIIEASLEEIWDYINMQMVYGNHLGLKGNVKTLLTEGDEKALKLFQLITSLKEKIRTEGLIKAKAIYQFFKVKPDSDSIIILNPTTLKEQTRFTFPRQQEGHQLCLTDFLNPEGDEMAFFVLTCGDGVADQAKRLLQSGDYFQSHGLSAIALEAAEGFAEYIHQRIRKEWGIPDIETITSEELFRLKYTGKRYSFGYPACPRLEDQSILWNLMKPDSSIGVTLTEDCMMCPEASVSAMVFHHPDARYFKISDNDLIHFLSQNTNS